MKNNIIFQEKNKLGIIILNRPEALNAINGELFSQLFSQLKKWEVDESIKAVLIKSNCEKAFCAGGDLREIYQNRHEPIEKAIAYFRLEYDVDQLLYHYSKPYISFLNGITMGAGVGISIHGSHPVGTENLKLAMPETKIGYFPDVGASYYLSRLPNALGIYLGLTGNSIDVTDAKTLNLIKQFVPSVNLDNLEKKLIETDFNFSDKNAVTEIINIFSEKINSTDPFKKANIINQAFSHETLEAILCALENNQDDFSQETLAALKQRSPTSLTVTLQQFQNAKSMNFNQVIEMDFFIAQQMLLGHDFFEGIRAMVIDKDKNPQWNPSDLKSVSDDRVKHYFKKPQ